MKSKLLLVMVLWMASTLSSMAGTLAVSLYGQEKDNWCWDASSKMVLDYYKANTITQTDIAAWAIGGENKGNHLGPSTVGPFTVDGSKTKPPATYLRKGCALVLTNFGAITSTHLRSSLDMAEIKTEIDGKRPAILAIRWKQKVGKIYKDAGGHAIVLTGYEAGDLVSLNDPWPVNSGVKYIVDYADMFTQDSTYYGSATIGNTWSETLKTGRSLDLCFLIDSTGSMGDDIANVKAASGTMIDDLAKDYKDLRIAVVDYRDNPVAPSGDPGDWITSVRTAFTADVATAKSAINAISVGGGYDTPEAVFSAVIRTLDGEGIGAWRPDAECRIILMGDAPGHDPEPWSGGYSYADVTAKWKELKALKPPLAIAIHGLFVGVDTSAEVQIASLAGATGGSSWTATDASGVVAAMNGMIDEFTATPSYPQGDTKALKPTFTFVTPSESMGPPIDKVLLELQVWNTACLKWRNYKKITLPDTASSWVPTMPLPLGKYQWRIGYSRKAGVFTLPDGTSKKVAGASIMEDGWTEFTRLEVIPLSPVQLSPSSSFTATVADCIKKEYTFSSAVNAEKYAFEVWKFDPLAKKGIGEWKRWKNLTVKPPAVDPTATVLEVTVSGHKIDAAYRWRVQSLNYDNPKPVDGSWVGMGP